MDVSLRAVASKFYGIVFKMLSVNWFLGLVQSCKYVFLSRNLGSDEECSGE